MGVPNFIQCFTPPKTLRMIMWPILIALVETQLISYCKIPYIELFNRYPYRFLFHYMDYDLVYFRLEGFKRS